MDKKDSGWKAFAGYRFSRHLAAEMSYINFGEYKARVTLGAASADGKADATAWGLAAVGIFPLSDRFDLFGKLGFVRGETDANVTIGATSVSFGDKGTELHYGFGGTTFHRAAVQVLSSNVAAKGRLARPFFSPSTCCR